MVGLCVPEANVRIATIDVGTNTVMCLVADVLPNGELSVLADEERFARLGEGVDAAGKLSPEAMSRVIDRLQKSKETADRFGVDRILIGATSASRDATNTPELIKRVQAELGLDYQVLSGEEEAELTCRGALSGVPRLSKACILDIGGGSTEIAVWENGDMIFRESMDVGSVRLTERFFETNPPSAFSLAQAASFARANLSKLRLPSLAGLSLVEGGGTARALVSAMGLTDPAPEISAIVVTDWLKRFSMLTPSEIRELHPTALTGREDVSTAALLILATVMEELGFETFIASRSGLRHGMILALADAL